MFPLDPQERYWVSAFLDDGTLVAGELVAITTTPGDLRTVFTRHDGDLVKVVPEHSVETRFGFADLTIKNLVGTRIRISAASIREVKFTPSRRKP